MARSEASQAKAKAWGIQKVYASYAKALEDDDIDAFSLCTPHFLHTEMLLAAMGAGKHAIGETPACTSTEEAHQLRVALYEHPELKMATGHVVRAWRTYGHAKKLVEDGAIGSVFYVSSNYTHKPPTDEYPGQQTWGRSPRALLHIGIAYHSVDLVR